jgi:hypothetical protein
LIIHEVVDYPALKEVFHRAAGIRKEAGERTYQVLKYQSDPNRIMDFSTWSSMSPRLIQIRAEAGVKSPDFTSSTSSKPAYSKP